MLRGSLSRRNGRVYGPILGLYRISGLHYSSTLPTSGFIVLFIHASSLSVLFPTDVPSGILSLVKD